MAVENKYTRFTEGVSTVGQCQANVKHGQCPFECLPPSQYCPMHGGITAQNIERRKAMARYRLGKYQERVSEFADDDEIKSLREEIGILRMLLEEVIVQCDTTNKLLIFTDRISGLVEQIRKLVETCQRLEVQNNELLGRNTVILIADSIVTRISNHISDPDKLKLIAGEIIEDIANVAGRANISGVVPQIDSSSV